MSTTCSASRTGLASRAPLAMMKTSSPSLGSSSICAEPPATPPEWCRVAAIAAGEQAQRIVADGAVGIPRSLRELGPRRGRTEAVAGPQVGHPAQHVVDGGDDRAGPTQLVGPDHATPPAA